MLETIKQIVWVCLSEQECEALVRAFPVCVRTEDYDIKECYWRGVCDYLWLAGRISLGMKNRLLTLLPEKMTEEEAASRANG